MRVKHVEEWKAKHKHKHTGSGSGSVPSFGSLFGLSSSVRSFSSVDLLTITTNFISRLRIRQMDLHPHTSSKREPKPRNSTLTSRNTFKTTRLTLKNYLNKINRQWLHKFQAIFGKPSISSGELHLPHHQVRLHRLVALWRLSVPSALTSRLLLNR
jgi:hypothetical protein